MECCWNIAGTAADENVRQAVHELPEAAGGVHRLQYAGNRVQTMNDWPHADGNQTLVQTQAYLLPRMLYNKLHFMLMQNVYEAQSQAAVVISFPSHFKNSKYQIVVPRRNFNGQCTLLFYS